MRPFYFNNNSKNVWFATCIRSKMNKKIQNDVNNQRFFKLCHNQNQKVQSANQFTANVVCMSVSRQRDFTLRKWQTAVPFYKYSSSLCEKRERECVSLKSIVSESIKLLQSLSLPRLCFLALWHFSTVSVSLNHYSTL